MIRKRHQMRVERREKMRGGPGHVDVHHIFHKDEIKSKTRLCAILTIPPGSGIGLHQHEAEDELFFIISGSGTIDDGTTKSTIETGDAVLTGNGASHSVINTGTANLEILAVIMPYA